MAFSKEKAKELLELHEGRRRYPYKDTVGKLTIGVGFNLDDEGLYDEEIDFILDNRLNKVYEEAQAAFPDFRTLNNARKTVIVDMLFNLGLVRLKGFKKMWAAVGMRDFKGAATEMLDSKWATQVGPRATRLAEMMRTGEWPENL